MKALLAKTLLTLALIALCCPAYGQSATSAVYTRQRSSSFRPPARGAFQNAPANRRGAGFGSVGFGYGGFGYGGFGFQSLIGGTYYQRPYPSHFDYYRLRYSSPSQHGEPHHASQSSVLQPSVPQVSVPQQATDCPCAAHDVIEH